MIGPIVFGAVIIGVFIGLIICMVFGDKNYVDVTGSVTNRGYRIKKSQILSCVDQGDTTLITLSTPISIPEGKKTTEMVVKEHFKYIVK